MNYKIEISNHKNSKFKSLLLRSLPDGRQGSSSGGKTTSLRRRRILLRRKNYKLKFKTNKIQTLVIENYPEASGDKAIHIVPSRHCEEWNDEAISLNEL